MPIFMSQFLAFFQCFGIPSCTCSLDVIIYILSLTWYQLSVGDATAVVGLQFLGSFLLVCRCVHLLTPFAIQVFFLMCCVCLPVHDNLPGGHLGWVRAAIAFIKVVASSGANNIQPVAAHAKMSSLSRPVEPIILPTVWQMNCTLEKDRKMFV